MWQRMLQVGSGEPISKDLKVSLKASDWELVQNTTTNYTLNYTEEGIEFSGRGTIGKESYFVLCTKELIDFTGYNTLIVNSDWVVGYSQTGFSIGLSDNKNFETDQPIRIPNTSNSADVSSATSPKYFKICLNLSGSTSYYQSLKFTDIHFNKST